MKTIGIYPGRFQPAHRGHLGVYKKLRQIAGPDTFIATSDKTPTPDSPLNFGEKQQIWVRHGVPSSNVVKVKNTYAPIEITQNFMADSTAAIYALGGKDVERFGARKGKDPATGKEMWMKSDGKTPSYFQPYKGNENDMQSFDKHGYVMVIEDIKIDGKPISGTNVREALSNPKYTPDQKKKFFQWAFGWYDPSLFQLLVDRFSEASKSIVPPVQKMPSMASMAKPQAAPKPQPKGKMISKETLQRVVAEMLEELAVPPSATPQGATENPADAAGDISAMDRAKREKETKANAVKAKQQAERDMDGLKKDLKWKQADIIKKRKDDIPNKRKEIDTLNKQISGQKIPSL